MRAKIKDIIRLLTTNLNNSRLDTQTVLELVPKVTLNCVTEGIGQTKLIQ